MTYTVMGLCSIVIGIVFIIVGFIIGQLGGKP